MQRGYKSSDRRQKSFAASKSFHHTFHPKPKFLALMVAREGDFDVGRQSQSRSSNQGGHSDYAHFRAGDIPNWAARANAYHGSSSGATDYARGRGYNEPDYDCATNEFSGPRGVYSNGPGFSAGRFGSPLEALADDSFADLYNREDLAYQREFSQHRFVHSNSPVANAAHRSSYATANRHVRPLSKAEEFRNRFSNQRGYPSYGPVEGHDLAEGDYSSKREHFYYRKGEHNPTYREPCGSFCREASVGDCSLNYGYPVQQFEGLSVQPHRHDFVQHHSSRRAPGFHQIGHRPSMPNIAPAYKRESAHFANATYRPSSTGKDFSGSSYPVSGVACIREEKTAFDANVLLVKNYPSVYPRLIWPKVFSVFGRVIRVEYMSSQSLGNAESQDPSTEILSIKFADRGAALLAYSHLLHGTEGLLCSDDIELDLQVHDEGVTAEKAARDVNSSDSRYSRVLKSPPRDIAQSLWVRLWAGANDGDSCIMNNVTKSGAGFQSHTLFQGPSGSYYTVSLVDTSSWSSQWEDLAKRRLHELGKHASDIELDALVANDSLWRTIEKVYNDRLVPRAATNFESVRVEDSLATVLFENIPQNASFQKVAERLARFGPILAIAQFTRKNSSHITLVCFSNPESCASCVDTLAGQFCWSSVEPLLIKTPDYTSIYIRNMPITVTTDQAHAYFGDCGVIEDVRLLKVKEGKDTTICFVDFSSAVGATNAMWKVFFDKAPLGRPHYTLLVEFTRTETPTLYKSANADVPPSI